MSKLKVVRHLFILSFLLINIKAYALTCTPSASIALDCSDLSLDGTFPLVTIELGATVTDLGGVGAVYIGNSTVNDLTNHGAILGDGGDGGVNLFAGSVGTLINTGSILDLSSSTYGLAIINRVAVGVILNSGIIYGYQVGIENDAGAIDILTNTNSGAIQGGAYGIHNFGGSINHLINDGDILTDGVAIQLESGGTIAILDNAGSIQGNEGVNVDSTSAIGILSNAGNISGGQYGISNSGVIANLANTSSGTISGGALGAGIYNQIGASIAAMDNAGSIDSIINSGSIYWDRGIAMTNSGVIGTITNTASGIISGGGLGIGIYNKIGASIRSIDNAGAIIGEPGIDNEGVIGSISNSGLMNTDSSAVRTSGSITTLTNSGLLSTGENTIYVLNGGSITTLLNDTNGFIQSWGVGVNNDGTITTLINAGYIGGHIDGNGALSPGADSGIANNSVISNLTNDGSIRTNVYGISNYMSSPTRNNNVSIASLMNNGSIDAGIIGIYNNARIDSLNNGITGTVSGGDTGISLDWFSRILTLTNDGVIYGVNAGLSNLGSITTITNNNVINSIGETAFYNGGAIGNLINHGNISTIGADNYAVTNDGNGNITTLTNTGTISADAYAISNDGTISHLNNSGAISGGAYGLRDSGLISTLTNTGTISGVVSDIRIDGAPIVTLNNLQSHLTMSGGSPTNYNIIIRSPTNFGQLAIISGTGGATTFGIYAGSSLANQTYLSVLRGFGLNSSYVSSGYLTALTGNYGGGGELGADTANCLYN